MGIFPLYQAGSTEQESIGGLGRSREVGRGILVNLAYVGADLGFSFRSGVDGQCPMGTVADDLQCVPRCVSAGHSDVGWRSSTK